jgi:peptide/nickel transport system substrate-binding protein
MRPSCALITLLGALQCVGCRSPGPDAARADAGSPGAIAVACGSAGCPREPGAARDGGQLVVAAETEPGILCDLVEHDVWGRWILENHVTETLLFQDPWSGAIGPRLAASFEMTDRTLTLHLRPGVTWHDGRPFTAADVTFTLGLARDPKVGADQRADLEPVTAIRQPDDHTVVLALGKPAPYLKQALAHISILPKHLYEGRELRAAPASRAPVGTGPFRFVAWRPGEEIVLERNPQYWGERAHLDRAVFRFVRDKQVALELVRRGEVDVMWRLPTARAAAELLTDGRVAGAHLDGWTPRAYFFVVWNTDKVRDPRVRRALTLLVDRDRFQKVAFDGHARPITGPYPPGTPSYDAQLTPWPYDPAAAKRLLADAGTQSLKLTLLLTAGSRTVEQLATLMKEDFAQAGIELDVATVDFAVLLDRLRRHAFDVSALQWTMSLEQDNYNMFHSSAAAGGQNYGSFRDAEADATMEKIRATADDAARHALDQKLQRRLHELQPYTFLCQPEVQTLIARRVHGFRPSIDGFTLEEAWVAP